MPDEPSAASDQTVRSDAGAQPAAGSAAPSSLVEHLLSDIDALQARDSETHQRLLDQIERRHAAEAALHAEKFKVAALQRDLELVQLRLKSVHDSLESVQRERNDLEQSLREIRASLMWRVGKTYWSVSRRITGR